MDNGFFFQENDKRNVTNKKLMVEAKSMLKQIAKITSLKSDEKSTETVMQISSSLLEKKLEEAIFKQLDASQISTERLRHRSSTPVRAITPPSPAPQNNQELFRPTVRSRATESPVRILERRNYMPSPTRNYPRDSQIDELDSGVSRDIKEFKEEIKKIIHESSCPK